MQIVNIWDLYSVIRVENLWVTSESDLYLFYLYFASLSSCSELLTWAILSARLWRSLGKGWDGGGGVEEAMNLHTYIQKEWQQFVVNNILWWCLYWYQEKAQRPLHPPRRVSQSIYDLNISTLHPFFRKTNKKAGFRGTWRVLKAVKFFPGIGCRVGICIDSEADHSLVWLVNFTDLSQWEGGWIFSLGSKRTSLHC